MFVFERKVTRISAGSPLNSWKGHSSKGGPPFLTANDSILTEKGAVIMEASLIPTETISTQGGRHIVPTESTLVFTEDKLILTMVASVFTEAAPDFTEVASRLRETATVPTVVTYELTEGGVAFRRASSEL